MKCIHRAMHRLGVSIVQTNTCSNIRVIVEYIRAIVAVLELNSVKTDFCESRNDAPDFIPTTFVDPTT
jgi:hypothetical protein